VVSTLKLLVDRRRINAIGDLSEAFATIAERRSGRVRAEIITATPLPDAYYAQLEKTLSEVTGRQVTIQKRTDPSIIGGVVARVGDTVFDGSIANRLKDLRTQLLSSS
jgi:F-type H+-transporting ATPase subunit delta